MVMITLLRSLLAPEGCDPGDFQRVQRSRALALLTANATVRALPEDEVLILPEPLLHPLLRPLLADQLELSLAQIADIARHLLALEVKGDDAVTIELETWTAREDELELDDDDDDPPDFYDSTGAPALRRAIARLGRPWPRWIRERFADSELAELLWIDRLPLTPSLRAALDETPLPGPPSPALGELTRFAPALVRLRRLSQLNAPPLLLAPLRRGVQEGLDRLCHAAATGVPWREWTSFDELMTGSGPLPCVPDGHAPYPDWRLDPEVDGTVPLAVALPGAGLRTILVMYAHTCFVVDLEGAVVDRFPTHGVRYVASSPCGRQLLFNSGGGPCSDSVYFHPRPFVRDVANARWLAGPLPEGLPRQVVGNVADLRWSIVADLERERGCLLLPGCMSDAPDLWTDPGHRYVWADGERMLLEIATGAPRFDTAWLAQLEELDEVLDEDELLPPRCFARAREGTFRFAVAGQLLESRPDGSGVEPRGVYAQGSALCFSADGRYLAVADRDELRISEFAPSTRTIKHRLDLAPLRDLLN